MSTHPHDALKSDWPQSAKDFSGRSAPCKIEADVQGLEVLGKVPVEMNGTFYRVFPDPNQPQTLNTKTGEMFIPIDGDGAVSAFRFKDGHVDWKHRYVQTERYKLEKRARKTLFGVYRNPYTNHPCVKAALDSTANTNVLVHARKLLALKESGQAYELDPNTLATLRYNPFNLKSETFTAHPKLDTETGELVCYGYEAKGLATRDICYFVLDKEGNLTKEVWFEWPEVGFMHDCILTKNYLILYSWSYSANVERMKAGGHHWIYDPDQPIRFAVVPRDLHDKSEVKWFEWGHGQPGHIASGWEENHGKTIVFQSSLVRGQDFTWLPRKGAASPKGPPASHYVTWKIDLTSSSNVLEDPVVLVDMPCEFPRVDDRTLCDGTGKFRHSWICAVVLPGTEGMPPPPPNVRVGLNSLVAHDNTTGQHQVYFSGWETHYQEPVFIPRSSAAPEGDGWVMALAERLDLGVNELVILDTKAFTGPPVAVVRLPLKLKPGIHGNWVEASAIDGGENDLGEVPDVPLIV